MKYASVILPLPLHNTYTYLIPDVFRGALKVGFRVIVPFGKKKYYTGIVEQISDRAPEGIDLKEIMSIPDETPIIKRPQIQLWEWVADYYLCSLGEVFKAALPAGLKLESESFIELVSDSEGITFTDLTDREIIVVQTLDHAGKKLSIGEIEKKTGLTGVSLVANSLIDKGIVEISERIVERYKSKKEMYVSPLFTSESSSYRKAFELVKGAKKQETALLALIELSELQRGHIKEVSVKTLKERSGVTTPILNSMVRKGIIELYKKEINRFSFNGLVSGELPILSDAQSNALNEIHKSWFDKDVTLLRGITSSGKTEIYIHLIDFVLKQKRQVLFLVPEIALTTHLTNRLQKVFGDKTIIYHSKFSDNERVDIWKKLVSTEEPFVIIGTRSSVFLPFGHLGLIIVDEEHDTSYKQQDPAPRYNGRDTAIVLAKMHGAKTLLGSATPAIDTYYKAKIGRYGLVELTERYGNTSLPDIRLVDMKTSRKKGLVKGALASSTKDLIYNSLEEGHQSIIFLNRRGYAPVVECKVCAWSPKCECCDVTLNYHKNIDKLVCHYCGAIYPLPSVCPSCKEPGIEIFGYGTERIEDEIDKAFEGIKITRMDRDTTRNKDGHDNLIKEFSEGRSQILVGTQMITKGLDFGNVSSVTIVNADAMLTISDFRANERAFNLMEQVSGRAGRREDSKGTVAIQAYSADNPVLAYVIAHDYTGFYQYEIEERRKYSYPPLTRLIYIYIKHRDKEAVEDLAIVYAHKLHHLFGDRVFGPEEPYIGRIQSMYIRKIMLKIEVEASMQKVREILRNLYIHILSSGHPYIKSAQVYYDVDPM